MSLRGAWGVTRTLCWLKAEGGNGAPAHSHRPSQAVVLPVGLRAQPPEECLCPAGHLVAQLVRIQQAIDTGPRAWGQADAGASATSSNVVSGVQAALHHRWAGAGVGSACDGQGLAVPQSGHRQTSWALALL